MTRDGGLRGFEDEIDDLTGAFGTGLSRDGAGDLLTFASFLAEPNPIARHYQRFRVADRLLFTGHSHQAWPDVAEAGMRRAFAEAAELVDDKWERAFAVAARVERGFAMLLDDPGGSYVLGENTHGLLVRLLSALPLRSKPRLVTSDGEFHTLRRQLARLEEEGIEVVRVPAHPPGDLGQRIAAAIAERPDTTAGALVSTVLFTSGRIVGGLTELAAAGERFGVPVVLDVYHQLDAVPMSLRAQRLLSCFVVGGGYKYCQLGEGNCFLRVPAGVRLRPVVTGWFGEMDDIAAPPSGVAYGAGAAAFAGATYDPVSHYRAAAVLDFHGEVGLAPELLRAISQWQVDRLRSGIAALDLPPSLLAVDAEVPLEELGGFLALRSPRAGAIVDALRSRGVWADHRHDTLRLGPAPYLAPSQLAAAVAALGEAVRAVAGSAP